MGLLFTRRRVALGLALGFVLAAAPAADARTLRGGGGADRLTGGGAADVLLGGRSADVLLGRGGTDRLFGAFGNDRDRPLRRGDLRPRSRHGARHLRPPRRL